MVETILRVFTISMAINIAWEFLHSPLYETMKQARWFIKIFRIIKASLGDAATITGYYLAFSYIFKDPRFHRQAPALITFVIASLLSSYWWEVYALNKGMWKYAEQMPLILKAGVTPSIQIAITGVITYYLALT